MRQQKPDSNVQRLSGFTLVELLVVIVILSILSALSLAGIQSARARGRISKTQSTIRKLSEIILPYYELYETRRPRIPRNVERYDDRDVTSEANRFALRRIMTMELPERSSDVTCIFPYTDTPTQSQREYDRISPYGQIFDRVEGNIPANDPSDLSLSEVTPFARRYRNLMLTKVDQVNYRLKDDIDSADLLYMIVMRGAAADADLTAHFRPDEIRDTDGNGLPEFVDGWNNPIKFLRWPVGFSSPLQPVNGQLGLVDDRVSANGNRLVPLIYSAGPDFEYDILELTNIPKDRISTPPIEFNYRSIKYDPFRFSSSGATPLEQRRQQPTVGGRYLYEVTRSSPNANTYIVAKPDVGASSPDTSGVITLRTTSPFNPFQAVGSELSLRARDNINNHDMTR